MNLIAVDDEELALYALNEAICEALPGIAPACFSKAADALDHARKTPVDVAFLDVRMAGMDGLALARELSALRPETNIIFVTGYSAYSQAALELYASGYVRKPVRAGRILRELAHLRHPTGGGAGPGGVPRPGPYRLDDRLGRVYHNGRDALLTPKEYQLFRLLASNAGRFLAAEELYEAVWGGAPNHNVRTVYKHVSRLREKLRMSEDSAFGIEARRNLGYRLVARG